MVLFFKSASVLNRANVPSVALIMQGIWAAILLSIRTYHPATGTYGNLYSNLLDYIISAALIFYILTIAALFRLRKTRPNAERPYRAFGYPIVPALYLISAVVILVVLFVYRRGDNHSRSCDRVDRRACVLSFQVPNRA